MDSSLRGFVEHEPTHDVVMPGQTAPGTSSCPEARWVGCRRGMNVQRFFKNFSRVVEGPKRFMARMGVLLLDDGAGRGTRAGR